MRALVALILWTAALVWMPLSANAFGLAPAILDLEGSRGEVVKSSFQLINTSAAAQTFYLETLNFSSGEEDGTPAFVPYEVDHSGLPEWIHFDHDRILVAARSSAVVSFEAAVPADVASEEYRAAVVVSDRPYDATANTESIISTKVAVLVFLTVQGNTIEKAALLDFQLWDGSTTQSEVVVPYSFRIQSQGNVSLIPDGTVVVRDFLGRVIVTKEVNPEQGRVLPSTTREFSGIIGVDPRVDTRSFLEKASDEMHAFAIGPVTATLEVTSNSGSSIGTETTRFWVIPWHLLSLVGLVVLGIGLLAFALMRRYSKQ